MSGQLRIDRVITSGTFSLDGGTWDVDNNVWVIGDDSEVVIVDAAHTAPQIVDAVAARRSGGGDACLSRSRAPGTVASSGPGRRRRRARAKATKRAAQSFADVER